MNREGFRQVLRERRVPDDQIEPILALSERFETFAGQPPTGDDVRAFASLLAEEGLNTWENIVAIARYGRFIHSDPVYVAAVELFDGAEVLDVLYDKLGLTVGEQTRDAVFAGIDRPPIGTPSSEKPRITQAVMQRLERLVDPDTCRQILSGGLRDLRDEWYLDDKARYEESGNIDAYLERKGNDYIAQLRKHRDEGSLYFTQPITDEVIDFVDSHPEIRQGVRVGTVVYETKVPYMAVEYLAATDDRLKRYYYCHCPWVRESIKSGDVDVSPTFCLCSAGYMKKSWEVIFGQRLEVEMIETVLKGDPWCRFATHLPPEALASVTA